MTQFECGKALLKLAEAAREIVKLHNPEINHVSIRFNDLGFIAVDGIKWDYDAQEIAEGDLLDAVKFSDGTVRFGGQESAS